MSCVKHNKTINSKLKEQVPSIIGKFAKYIMNKIVCTITALLSLTSCAGSYDIEGTSNVSDLDGQKLYLKVAKDGSLKNLDSCDVVHGRFSFSGKVDSAHVARIFMDSKDLSQPVVIEQGTINIRLDNTQQKISGTPLNDKLNKFWNRFMQIRNQYADIDHEQSAAIMNGQDEATANIRLTKKALRVFEQGDKLFTKFVTENFDNVLGPWGFFTRIQYDTTPDAYPSWLNDYLYATALDGLPSWIEYIMANAPESFKNDPEVKQFYQHYQETLRRNNGTMEDTPASTMTEGDVNVAPPTPNQMAEDSIIH